MNVCNVKNSGINDSPPQGLHLQLRRSLGQGAFGHCYEAQVWFEEPKDNTAHAASHNDHNACGVTAETFAGFTQELVPDAVKPSSSKAVNNQEDVKGKPSGCELMAVKIIWAEIYKQKKHLIENEVRRHLLLNHENILRLLNAFYIPEERICCLLLELCPPGSIVDIMKVNGNRNSTNLRPLQPHIVGLITRSLVQGLDYLHSVCHLVHRDIKPTNVLLSGDLQAKISDFGLACSIEQCKTEKTRICGTPNYLAPEVFLREGHSPASDLWAVGATLCFMITACPPFTPRPQTSTVLPNVAPPELAPHQPESINPKKGVASDDVEHKSNSVRGIFRAVLLGEYKVPVDNATAAAVTVTRGLLRRLPEERLTPKDILGLELCKLPEGSSFGDNASGLRLQHISSMLPAHHLQNGDCMRDRLCNGTCQLPVPTALPIGSQTNSLLTTPSSEVNEQEQLITRLSTPGSSTSTFVESPVDGVVEDLHCCSISPFEPCLQGTSWLHSTCASEWSQNRFSDIQEEQRSVLTGNMNILDIINVLADRALKGPNSSCRFFWVSRWAVTNKATLFYTLEEAVLPPVESQLDSKMKITELLGATSTIGDGRVLHDDNKVTQFSQSKLEDGEQTAPGHRMPSTEHVREQCSRLQRNLCRFRPSLKVINESGQPVESASSSSSSSPLFVLRWTVWEEGITLLFSNGGWQANYSLDHTKIVVFGRSGLVCIPGPANGSSLNSTTLWFTDIADWFRSHPQHGFKLARPLSNFI